VLDDAGKLARREAGRERDRHRSRLQNGDVGHGEVGPAGVVEDQRAAGTTALATGTVHVWWIPLDVDPGTAACLAATLSEEERARARQL
jgi:hypothetical protein